MTVTLVVLFMGAAEILLRTLCTYCTWTEVNGGKFESPYAINESSWYFVRPSNSIDSYHQPEFDYEIRTNSLGFRDIEHPLDKLLVYQPDIVMMVVNGSDANDIIARGGEERFLPNGRVKGVEHPSGASAWLYKHSHFSRFILLDVSDYTHLLLYKAERGRRAMEAREKIKTLIVKLDNQLKDIAVEFVLVVLPS